MTDVLAKRVPRAIRDAIKNRDAKLILLYEFDDPAGTVRGWSGVGKLRYAGEVWLGLGDLVLIDGIGGSRRTEVRVITVTLGGVNARQLKLINHRLRGRKGTVSLAALRKDCRAVNGPICQLVQGICDSQDYKIDESRNAQVILTFNQPIFILDRAANLAWTPDWIKAEYGDDIVGLDDVPGLATRVETLTFTS